MDKKKIISIAIVILTIVVVVIIAATSGGDSKDPEVTVTEATTSAQQFAGDEIILGYSAEVLENSLKVYKDDVFVEELTYPADHNGKFDLEFAKNHISFLDMNFDGYEDICLTISSSGEKYGYYCWIYDKEADKFQYNKTLSALTSISVDNSKKQIISTEEKDGKAVYVLYEWKNGDFQKLETTTKAPEAVKNNVVGSTTSGSTTSRPDKNQSATGNSGISGTVSSGNSGSQGSDGGIIIVTEDTNDIWY